MSAVTAAVLAAVAAGLWISGYFREIAAWIREYFFREDAGFPRTRKRRK
jgi:hypothetical protein